MTRLYLIPRWFFGTSILLEIFFGIITLGVALYSFHIYRYSRERSIKLFGLGFLSISLAYFLWSFVNIFLVPLSGTNTTALALEQLTHLGTIGVISYMAFFIVGLSTLVYMALRLDNNLAYSLITSLALVSVIFSQNKALAFYFISSFFLVFVLYYYVMEYLKTRSVATFITLAGFFFLLLGSLDFTMATIQEAHYVVGHLLILVGYLFILFNFLNTLHVYSKQ